MKKKANLISMPQKLGTEYQSKFLGFRYGLVSMGNGKVTLYSHAADNTFEMGRSCFDLAIQQGRFIPV